MAHSGSASPVLRVWSDEVVISRLGQTFLVYKVESVSTELLKVGPTFRPPNETNLMRITEGMRKGFRHSEALLVWRTSSVPMPVLSGNQQLQVANILGVTVVPCIFLERCSDPPPLPDDLLFAHQRAALFERNGAPRSVLSRLIEIRAIVNQFERRGHHVASVSVKHLRRCFPPHGQGGPYFSHWSQGVGEDHLRSHLKCAKTFRAAGIDGIVDEIERICYDPTRISADFLFTVSRGELLRRRFGLEVMNRLLSEMQNNPRAEITFTEAERDEFKELTGGEKISVKRKKRVRSESSEGDAIRKFRRGVSILKDGVSVVDSRSLVLRRRRLFTDIRRKIRSLEELVENFSKPDSR